MPRMLPFDYMRSFTRNREIPLYQPFVKKQTNRPIVQPYKTVKATPRKVSMPKIKGIITDSNGTPIPLVNVSVANDSTRGTTTDFDGNYTLSVLPAEKIRVGYVGFKTLVKTAASFKPVEALKEEVNSINEVDLGVIKRTAVVEKTKSNNGIKWLAGGLLFSAIILTAKKTKQGLKAPEGQTLNVIL